MGRGIGGIGGIWWAGTCSPGCVWGVEGFKSHYSVENIVFIFELVLYSEYIVITFSLGNNQEDPTPYK